jgi:hypothetical protein
MLPPRIRLLRRPLMTEHAWVNWKAWATVRAREGGRGSHINVASVPFIHNDWRHLGARRAGCSFLSGLGILPIYGACSGENGSANMRQGLKTPFSYTVSLLILHSILVH